MNGMLRPFVFLKLKEEGKTEFYPTPHPVWHSPMFDRNRLSDYQIFTDYMMKLPPDSPGGYPPASLWGK